MKFEISVFNDVGRYVSHFDRLLLNVGLTSTIDEIAFLFLDSSALNNFIHLAVQEPGCLLFHSSDDEVSTLPVRSSYRVQYSFLSVPSMYLPLDHAPVRIEAMEITSGMSPLHERAFSAEPFESAVHASFKCSSEEAYAEAQWALKKAEFESVQRCTSSYGRFSYWFPLNPDEETSELFVKPRVNLR